MRILVLLIGGCVVLSAAPARADETAGPAGPAELERGGAPSKVPAYIGTSVAAGLLVTSVVSYFKYEAALKARRDKVGAQRDDWYQAAEDAQRWHDVGLFCVGATIVAGGITGYLWSRTEQAPRHLSVTADGTGASAWVTGSF